MTKSSLCTYTNLTSNYSTGRKGESICKITPHYMAAHWTGKRCADYFAETSRQASSNYCIGYDGDIAMSVDEDNRAWTSSSGWNDRKAITIECACASPSDSTMSTQTWDALVALCVDICKRYNFKLEYTGDKSGSLTEHRFYSSTDCPGAWLHARMEKLAKEVNGKLDGASTSDSDTSSDDGESGFDMARLGSFYRNKDKDTYHKEVACLQACLNAQGYGSLVTDGYYGSATANAVEKFQKDKGLSADRVCGPATWAALFGV